MNKFEFILGILNASVGIFGKVFNIIRRKKNGRKRNKKS